MENILEIKNISKKYKTFLLDDISFNVPSGKIIGMIGTNGSGKSTTINSILDLIKKDSGEVTYWGKQLNSDVSLKEDIGVIIDGVNFYEKLTPRHINKICKGIYKNWDSKAFKKYLTDFDLDGKKQIKELSKGMQMKLSLAICLSHNAKLLILDEATNGIDPIFREEILETFLDFVKDGDRSILMTSHITTDLEKIADNIILINKGKIILDIEKDKLMKEYGVIKCSDIEFNTVANEDMVTYRKIQGTYEILVKDKNLIKEKYKELEVDNLSIDDVFLLFVKGVK